MSLLHDDEGRLRNDRTFVVIALLVFLIGLTTVMIFFIGTAVAPSIVILAALIVLVLVKAPLLVLVWRLMGRHMERPGEPSWDGEERSEILAYLEREAQASLSRPDARARLDYLTREAWNVADRSPDDEKAQAVATALRIRALTPAAAGAERAGPEG